MVRELRAYKLGHASPYQFFPVTWRNRTERQINSFIFAAWTLGSGVYLRQLFRCSQLQRLLSVLLSITATQFSSIRVVWTSVEPLN